MLSRGEEYLQELVKFRAEVLWIPEEPDNPLCLFSGKIGVFQNEFLGCFCNCFDRANGLGKLKQKQNSISTNQHAMVHITWKK